MNIILTLLKQLYRNFLEYYTNSDGPLWLSYSKESIIIVGSITPIVLRSRETG